MVAKEGEKLSEVGVNRRDANVQTEGMIFRPGEARSDRVQFGLIAVATYVMP